jgi:hypothetical protein
MGGVRALRLAQSAAIPDPVLAQDLINFMRDCINPELAMTPTYVNGLVDVDEHLERPWANRDRCPEPGTNGDPVGRARRASL